MNAPTELVQGCEQVVDRFGQWPSFYDAEIVRLHLARDVDHGSTAEMTVHTWVKTDQVDSSGYFVLDTHTLIMFRFETLLSSTLLNFNHQNCLMSMAFERAFYQDLPIVLTRMETSFGLEGSVLGRGVRVTGSCRVVMKESNSSVSDPLYRA